MGMEEVNMNVTIMDKIFSRFTSENIEESHEDYLTSILNGKESNEIFVKRKTSEEVVDQLYIF